MDLVPRLTPKVMKQDLLSIILNRSGAHDSLLGVKLVQVAELLHLESVSISQILEDVCVFRTDTALELLMMRGFLTSVKRRGDDNLGNCRCILITLKDACYKGTDSPNFRC